MILVRKLEADAFGLVAMASALVAILDTVSRSGFAQALVQRTKLDQAHLDTAFWSGLLTGMVMTVGTLLLADPISKLYAEPLLAPMLRWLSLTFIISALGNVHAAILRRRLAFRSLAVRGLLSTVIGGAVGIAMAMEGFGVWSLVGQLLGSRLVGVVTLWLATRWTPGMMISVPHFRELGRFGLYLIGADMLGMLTRRLDVLLIGYLLGSTAVGYYAVSAKLLRMLTQALTQTMASVAFPTFSRMQHDRPRLRSALYTAVQMTSLIAWPAFLGIAVLAPEIGRLVFPEKYAASVGLLRVLAFAGLLQASFFFNGPLLLALGKPSWRLMLRILHFTTQALVIWVAARWGLLAVATAVVIRPYLLAPIPLAALHRLIEIDRLQYLRLHTGPLVGSICMIVAVELAKWQLAEALAFPALLPVYILIGAVAYTLALWLVARPATQQALQLFRIALWKPRYEQPANDTPSTP